MVRACVRRASERASERRSETRTREDIRSYEVDVVRVETRRYCEWMCSGARARVVSQSDSDDDDDLGLVSKRESIESTDGGGWTMWRRWTNGGER